MYPSRMLYDTVRQQQAEEVARAERRRRRPRRAAPWPHLVAAGFRLAKAPRRRLARISTALGVGPAPHH